MTRRIDGTRVAVLVSADEHGRNLRRALDVLREQGGEADVVAPGGPSPLRADFAFTERDLRDTNSLLYDGVLVLGTAEEADRLGAEPAAIALVDTTANRSKPVVAVGGAVRLLALAGVLDEREVACRPSDAERVTEGGGRRSEARVHRDGHVLTACEEDALDDLLAAMLAMLARRPDERKETKPDW